ncbi:MAG: serine--tRNA ligase [Deltaproteobacteria bacterium]|nr:serine--tRNA ligase [Deltaproteobacteria bacterium]
MLDVKFVRDNSDTIQKMLADRNMDFDLGGFLELDAQRRRGLQEIETLRAERNRASEEIARRKRENRDVSPDQFTVLKEVGSRIKIVEDSLKQIEEQTDACLMSLPNIPHTSVPVGKDEQDNTEVRAWGAIPQLNFEPRQHFDIGEQLGILDFDRAARMTGARFSLLTGAGARLERALINFMLDVHTTEHGYCEVLPPLMVNRRAMTGTGQLPKFEKDLFKIEAADYFLIPTAEVPLTNIHQQEILSEDDLPCLYTAFTPCFRSEAGSYGKDTRGLIRQHQFNKVEMVKFTRPEDSYAELEKLLANAETILQKLNISYRVVSLCTGDLGFSAAKTYDIEVWLPGQNAYREISSCSNFEDFQARRASIRFKRKGGNKTELVHTLNGSGLAVGRTLVAVLENYQQADGSVTIPEVLRPYMGGLERISK